MELMRADTEVRGLTSERRVVPSRGVILSAAVLQAERRIWRGLVVCLTGL